MKPRSSYGPTGKGKARRLEYCTVPKPDVSLRTGKPIASNSESDFQRWHSYVGIEQAGKKLTEQMLREWANDPKRQLQCVFDGELWPSNYWYCPRCKEYKGLMPYIPGWSDWE